MGRGRLPVWDDVMVVPSGSLQCSGRWSCWRLSIGESGWRKWPVAPLSATAEEDGADDGGGDLSYIVHVVDNIELVLGTVVDL